MQSEQRQIETFSKSLKMVPEDYKTEAGNYDNLEKFVSHNQVKNVIYQHYAYNTFAIRTYKTFKNYKDHKLLVSS